MRVVHSWLQELAPVGHDVDALADVMTDLGLAVEEIIHVGATVDGVITARVLRTERHPEAAKVHRVYVDAGDGRERHVWCGAFNMQAGDIVPLATPGTAMPDGRVIEPKPILGIQSDGMLCSARELGLGDDHAGIVILPADTPLGLPYGVALRMETETVYDVDVTRNLPDCFGYLGIARQVAARLGVQVKVPDARITPTSGAPTRQATVELVDGDRCARFTSTVISGVLVTSSPDWMTRRLTAAGMRSINNVVDVSNYVMLELNQPNHAYDLDALGGSGFRVRRARDGETMVTLDGVERSFTADDLLICDANDVPIGIGGIMGGLDSEISDTTTTIALEIAWFEPIGIAKTAGRLGLRSEASLRFDRGVDPDGMPLAVARFVELLRLTCPDLVVHDGMVDARSEQLPVAPVIDVRVDKVNALLGTSLSGEEMSGLIAGIGFTTRGDPTMAVTVPSWRPDCVAEVDITEEIARQYGYSKVGKTVPKSAMHGHLSPVQTRRRRLREVLLGLGISEAMPNPFLADDDLIRAGLEGPAVRIVNSLVAEESVLRTTLRPGLLKAIAFNESHRRPGVALFEIGHAYPPGDGELPAEFEGLAVALAGRDAIAAVEVWREVAATMGFGARVDQSKPPPGLHPTRSATLSLGRDTIGALGEVHPDVLDAYGVDERVAVLELNLSILLANDEKVAVWKPTSRFPSSDLDLAFLTPDSVIAEKVEKAIKQAAGSLLVDLALFDVYRGAGVPVGSRSLAYRLRFQALDRTLGEAELTDLRNKIIAAVGKLDATLRACDAPILIVGAGFGGIAAAIELRKHGFDDVTLLERGPELGGTWFYNGYPGAACDVPSHLYSYSFAQRRDWSRLCSPRDEILDYLRGVARQFGVDRLVQTGVEVTACTWGDEACRWTVTAADGRSWEGAAVVLATGQLHRPALPGILGLDDFTGCAFHSAEWDHDFDLRDRRVAVIGTGASAVQFLPSVVAQAGSVVVFQRTGNWFMPRRSRPYPRLVRWAARNVPGLQAARRRFVFEYGESLTHMIRHPRTVGLLGRARSAAFMRMQLRDPELRSKVWPRYTFGCKRVLFSSEFLPALARPNVELVTDAIERMTDTGPQTTDGRVHEVDCVIYGTGFRTNDFMFPMAITGVDGRTLRNAWAAGPHAHLGICVPGFPSLFVMYGPNTNTSGGSIIVYHEAQASYIRQALELVRDHGAAAIEVRAEVEAQSDSEVQARFAGTAWTACDSWYRDASGRIVANWPGTMREYQRRTRQLDPNEFTLIAF